MPDIKRLGPLIDRLRKLSDENQVPWVETADERAFQAALKGCTVTIAEEDAGDYYGEAIYHFRTSPSFRGEKLQRSPTGPL
jgi:hypothetical protein